MRWLVVCLLASLAALLMVALAMARHIWVQRAKLRREPPSRVDRDHESDHEL
jgi:uncharacterized iron-regulated membrane protein